MQLEATRKLIKYRLKTGEEVTLQPGVPMELPDHAAVQLLKKAPGQVRLVHPFQPIEAGAVMTWQGADLIRRKGVVDFLHTDKDGTVWAFVTTCDGWAAVNTRYSTAD